MKKVTWRYSLLLLICFLPQSAHASLINHDWQTPGDNGLTLDPSTNIEWLDLTYTAGQSYNEVFAQLGPDGIFTGFRFATIDDVMTFFIDAGIPDIGARTAANYDPIDDLLRQVGRLRPLTGGSFSHAITGTSASADQQYWSLLQVILTSPPFQGEAQTGLCCVSTDSASSDTGSWLIRNAAVPEPSTLSLLGLGMLLPIWRSRRMRA